MTSINDVLKQLPIPALQEPISIVSQPDKKARHIDVTPQQKDERSQFLVSVFEKYQKASPFYVEPNFLRSLAQKFINFFRWLFRMGPPFPLSAIEMQFAMQLFRTCDAKLIAQAGSDSLPFSYILESWIHFLKEMDSAKDSNELMALEKCVEYQKTIERVRNNAHPLWKKALLSGLHSDITESLKDLKEGEFIYIPGGYLTKNEENGNNSATEMLYEVRRTNGNFVFRVFNNTDRMGNTHVETTYCLTQEKVEEHLRELLEVQTISSGEDNCKGIYRLFWPFSNKTPSETRLNDVFKQFSENTSPVSTSAKPRQFHVIKSDEKLLELFFKCQDQQHFTLQKMGLKLALLFDMFDKSKDLISTDDTWRKWYRDTALNMLSTLQRRVGDGDELNTIKDKLKEIVSLVSDFPIDPPASLPLSPNEQNKASHTFSDPIIFSQDDIAISAFSKLNAKRLETLSPLPVDKNIFENLLASCAQLSKERKFDLLRLRLNDAYNCLFSRTDKEWAEESSAGLEEWTGRITQLAKYAAQLNFGNDERAPLPQHFLQLLKSFELAQRLTIQNNDKTHFQGYHFAMSDIRDVLKDPYLDLGGLGPEIFDVLQAIDPSSYFGPTRVKLISSEPIGDDFNFFSLHTNGLSDAEKAEVYQDLGDKGRLPANIVHMRQLNILLMMMTARYRVLHYPGIWSRVKAVGQGLINFLTESMEKKENPSMGVVEELVKKIDQHLQQAGVPETMSAQKPYMFAAPTPYVDLYGLHLHDYSEALFQSKWIDRRKFLNAQFPSLYKGTAQSIQTEGIEQRIITGIVADYDNLDAWEDGSYVNGIFEVSPTYSPAGNKKTEQAILDERFRFHGQLFDTSADLQLMQTAPLTTRIQNTLGCFVRNPSVLVDPKAGHEWQRVMSLNLFRNGALHRFLKDYPHYADTVVNSLIDITKQLEFSGHVEGVLFMIHLIDQALPILQQRADLTRFHQSLLDMLSVWHAKADTEPSYKMLRREIHQAYLLHFTQVLKNDLKDLSYNPSQDPKVQNHLQNILKSYCIIQQIPEPKDRINATQRETIRYMMYRLLNCYPKLLENEATRHQWLNAIVKDQVQEELTWTPSKDSSSYTSGKWTLDIMKGLLYIDNVARCPLPTQIASDTLCKQLFGDRLTEMIVDHWIAGTKEQEGQVYEFVHGSDLYRILLISGENPLVFKKTADMWSQLHVVTMSYSQEEQDKGLVLNTLNALKRYFEDTNYTNEKILKELNREFKDKNAPCALSEYYFWVNETGTDFIVENKKREHLFSGKVELKNTTVPRFKWVYDLKKELGNSSLEVLNPWQDPHFDMFLRMDRPSQMLATGSRGTVDHVKYHRFDLEYQWNDTTKQWQSAHHKGYYLSNKKVEEILKLGEHRHSDDHKNPTFFGSGFTHYHLLEHESKTAKLQIVGEQCKKAGPQDPAAPDKHLKKKVEPIRSNSGADMTELYTFDVDPLQGLKTTSSEGYLYLAYILYTQSKYAEAIHYLRKAQDIKPKMSKNADKILKWFDQWESKSPSAKTVLMHVQLIKLEQLKTLHTKPPLTEETQETLSNIIHIYSDYKEWKESGKIDQQLHLSPKQVSDIFYTSQIFSDEIKTKIDKFGDQLGIPESGKAFFNLLNTFIQQVNQENQDKQDVLTKEIDQLKLQIANNALNVAPQPSIEQAPAIETPIFEEKDAYIKCKPPQEHVFNMISKQMEKLKEVFERQESYTKELGMELITDLVKAMNKQQESDLQFADDVNYNDLQKGLKTKHTKLEAEAQDLKRKITAAFSFASLPAGSLLQLTKRLEEEDASKEKFFEEALYAYGSNHWQTLLDQNIVTKEQIPELEICIEDYLIKATQKQQYQQALVLIEELLQMPSDEVVANQLIALLNSKRHYDPKTDPYRRACLLLEFDSKIIARKNQIQNVYDMLKKENLFKHEALAGGKTTVLRNIITKIKADGVHLSGVITHDPLIEMHHALYTHTTNHAYGDRAIRFEFVRKDPTDVIALKAIYRNLLKTVANHGRIDMTKKDALNFHHSYLMKFEELSKAEDQKRVEEIHAEIDLMGEILTLLREKCRIGSDELDKICDPKKEQNYATGIKKEVDAVKRDAAFEIVKWLLRDNHYKEIFQNNKQYRLTDKEIDTLRLWISTKVCEKYFQNVDTKEALHYFTGLGEGNSNAFYDKNIASHPQVNTLKAFQKLISEVIAGPITHRNGVTYGRSKDLVLVKPHEGNGECAENSKHGTEEEMIWFACLNYMDKTLGGVFEEQVAQLVLHEQSEASKIVLQSQKVNPEYPVEYNQTPQAVQFKAEFNLDLHQVTPTDYPAIARSINDNPEKLVKFLESRIFSQMSLSAEKIVGNSTDLVNLYKEFYGSSGTSNISRALPSKIIKDPSLIKQEGVDGDILLRLIKDYQEGDIIELKENVDTSEQIATLLQGSKGAALIDQAPAYPGKQAKEIVLELSQKMSDQSNKLRFVDKDKKVHLYDPATKKTQISKDNANLDTTFTIFDKANTRGTDLVLDNHSIGYVTLGADSEISEVEQAVARMRKLGKGQKVRYLIDAGVKRRLNNNVTFENLLAMLVDNEAKGLKKLHLKAEKQAIQSIAKCAIFDGLPTIPKDARKQTWADVRKFFIQETQESLESMGRPKRMEDTTGVLKQQAKSELDKLDTVPTTFNVSEAVKQLKDKESGKTLIDKIYLPPRVFKGNFDQEMQQEVEKEQEQEQQQEQEQEQEQVMGSGANTENGYYHDIGAKTISELIARLELGFPFYRLNDSAPFYDGNIYYTLNYNLMAAKVWGAEKAGERLPDKLMRESRFVMVVDTTNDTVYTVLGTKKDFDHALKKLNQDDPRYHYYIYNMDRHDFDGLNHKWENYNASLQEKLVRAIVQAKLVNGETYLIDPKDDSVAPMRQEYRAFKGFLDEKSKAGVIDPQNLQINLKKFLTRMRPTLAAGYATSPMARAFKATNWRQQMGSQEPQQTPITNTVGSLISRVASSAKNLFVGLFSSIVNVTG